MAVRPFFKVLIGKSDPSPLEHQMNEAIESVEVMQTDDGRSGFQIMFRVGRRPNDQLDYRIVPEDILNPFNRVIIYVKLTAKGGMSAERVIMDGIITHHQFSPGDQPGRGILTVTGEDISVMMDMEEKVRGFVQMNESTIATKIINEYSKYQLTAEVKKPPVDITPPELERVPMQRCTDLEYLRLMARRYNYKFYIRHGDTPKQNFAYWGPPVRSKDAQPRIRVNMMAGSNGYSVQFQHNALAPTRVADWIYARGDDEKQRITADTDTLEKPLSKRPTLSTYQGDVRKSFLRKSEGLNYAQAQAQAQAMVDHSVEEVVTATGEVDALLYGAILTPFEPVAIAGVGNTYNGLYYVKSVNHMLTRNTYKQQFTMVREGIGSTI